MRRSSGRLAASYADRRRRHRRDRRPRLAQAGIRRRLARLAGATVLAGCLAMMAACCPVPVGAGPAPTAFDAVVVSADASAWVAEGRDGRSYRVAGPAPAPLGGRVYLTGTILADGSVRVEHAEPIAAR